MLYGKGGYTNAKARGSYSLGGVTERDSTNLEGYRLGAGVETNMMGLLGRIEYRYSSYGDHLNSGIDVERHQVALLVGYRFDLISSPIKFKEGRPHGRPFLFICADANFRHDRS